MSAPGYAGDLITFASATILQLRLSRMDKQIFPLPHYSLRPQKKLHDSPLVAHCLVNLANAFTVSGLLKNVRPLEMGDVFELSAAAPKADEPPTRARTFDFLPDSPEAVTAQAKLNDTANEAAQAHAKETWKEYLRLVQEAQDAIVRNERSRLAAGSHDEPCSDIRVIPLGTGSAMPSKYRNGEHAHSVALRDAEQA